MSGSRSGFCCEHWTRSVGDTQWSASPAGKANPYRSCHSIGVDKSNTQFAWSLLPSLALIVSGSDDISPSGGIRSGSKDTLQILASALATHHSPISTPGCRSHTVNDASLSPRLSAFDTGQDTFARHAYCLRRPSVAGGRSGIRPQVLRKP
ncbi:hypothetical protein OE88DRAFT_212295 [Heliocybe sulcata]|uniref:Uncharacterized protein n=1 Tax=Heliocybe sulcata TaxID=5364 RepID=A0A5C3N4J8_9AGAM|nr:hypothetical protein OE88DRAFT_212295 [Heliocybe sulcata]